MTLHQQNAKAKARASISSCPAKTLPIALLGLALSFPAMLRAQDSTGLVGSGTLDLRLLAEDLSPTRVVSQPDFSGTWLLDKTRSDDPKQALRADVQRPGRSGSGGRGQASSGLGPENGAGPGSRGGSRGGGRMGRGGGDRGARPDPERLAGLFSQQLEILQQSSMVTISTASGRSRRVVIDDRGAWVASSVSGLGQGVTTGRWQDSTLILETESKDGRSVVQRFRILAQPRRLELVTELPMQRQDGKAIEVTQVFLPSQQLPKRQ